MYQPPRRSGAELLASWRTLHRVRGEEERRSHLRREVHIAARVIVGNLLHDCTVLDISPCGARIALEAPQDIPGEFAICMTPQGFPIRRCKLIWRSDSEIGFEFDARQQLFKS